MALAIETCGLNKRLGERDVIRGLDLRVPEGAVYGFLGPNGSGKTTAMRLMLGLLVPDSGSVALFGKDFRGHRRELLGQVGAFIETHGLYEHLTGRANLALACILRGLEMSEVDRVLDIVSMRGAADHPVRAYSLGMKQRTALARALLGRPRLLLLDEPTNGLDPEGIMAMRELVRGLPSRIGATILLSSHLLSEVEGVASDIGLLKHGTLVAQGSVARLGSGRRKLRIVVDRRGPAIICLEASGLEVTLDHMTGEILVPLPDDEGSQRHDAATINRLLVEAGFAVSALHEERLALEGLYREAMGVSPSFEREAA